MTEGIVTATATAITRGNTIATYQIEIVDEEQRRVSTGRLTCLVRERRD